MWILRRALQRLHILPPPPNFTHVGGSLYIVRTQAGFKQAIKHWRGEPHHGKERVEGHPRSYPALVSLSSGYSGYHYVSVTHVHLKRLRGALRGQ